MSPRSTFVSGFLLVATHGNHRRTSEGRRREHSRYLLPPRLSCLQEVADNSYLESQLLQVVHRLWLQLPLCSRNTFLGPRSRLLPVLLVSSFSLVSSICSVPESINNPSLNFLQSSLLSIICSQLGLESTTTRNY